jgi:hypothetical protein
MSAIKVALAGLAALAGPMIYVADPVRPERQPPVSEPVRLAQAQVRPAAVHEVRPGIRVILASPFDAPGTRQEAAPVSPALGVPEVLYAQETQPVQQAGLTATVQTVTNDEPIVSKSRRVTRVSARPQRKREPRGLFAAPFFAWLR